MGTEFIDNTGKPRSKKDIQEARKAIAKELINFKLPPSLLIYLPIVLNALDELLYIREQIEKQSKN